ncbi:PAS domain S-box protein [Desulfosporosinus sp. OT]|uniref:two-component system sensor histidine kinase NtrB n=1 Tax=Desulfosporosinus sp. OT TaxID=913865 RepID=UPI000223A007|nr:PAS domain S-box protein [Desulfosporosinus sp. OT]EGW38634.1 sensory box protein [Desulfosporosinus sp. OT]
MLEKNQKHNISADFMFDSWKKEYTHKLKFHEFSSIQASQTSKETSDLLNLSDEVNGISGKRIRVHENLAAQASNALKGAKRRRRLANYRMLFEHSCDSFLFIDLKGHILEANLAAMKVYGYTHEELCTMKIQDLRAEKTMDLIDMQLQAAYNSGIIFETCHVRKDGEHFPVEVSSHQVVVKLEKILLSVVRDITERKHLEKELVKTESINAIGKVASGLAHEIRNPITSVHGFLQLAASQRMDQIRFAENCNLMLQDLERANSVITELILVSNEKGMELKFWNLNQLLFSLLPTIQTIAKSQDKTVEIFLEETRGISLDAIEIKKLVLNLVNNALESMLPGGKVTLRTQMMEDALVLSITDNGSGINPEIQDKLGIPFFTTKDTGTGLGLVICNSIATRHNATLSIESNQFGTTVQIRFKG